MKIQALLVILIVIASLRASYCGGQTNVVFFGTNTSSLAVSFVDTNLSAVTKSAIVADLQLCLEHWGKRTEFRMGADDPAFVAHLYNPKTGPHYPETIDFPDNVVSNGTMGFALQIPNTLSDAYTNAFAFAAANSNVVAAAYEFVAFVSSSNFLTLSSNALPNYVLQKNVTTNQIIDNAQRIISDLRHQTYYSPSLLGFRISSSGPATSNLWMQIPYSSTQPWGGVEWGAFPAVWHEGRWKFCIWDNWAP